MYEKGENLKNCVQPISDEKPDFHKILEALREEVEFSRELMYRTYSLTESLKPRYEEKTSSEATPKEKSPIGIVELLWQQILILREINQSLNKSVNHLNTITC